MVKEIVLKSGLTIVGELEDKGENKEVINPMIVITQPPNNVLFLPVLRISKFPCYSIKLKDDDILALGDVHPDIALNYTKIVTQYRATHQMRVAKNDGNQGS